MLDLQSDVPKPNQYLQPLHNPSNLTQLTNQQTQLQSQIAKNQQDLDRTITDLTALEQTLPAQEATLAQHHAELAELEKSGVHSDWQAIQTEIKSISQRE
nr:hypothetical protein [Chamaesiphon sp. VAR_48_metabat_135_sub]